MLFPIYRLVLLRWAEFYLSVWLLVSIGFAILDRSTGGSHPWASGIFHVGQLWLVALTAFTVITGIFAALESYQAKSKFLEQWNPRKLPRLRDRNQIPRSSSAAELAWDGMPLLWWIDVLRIPRMPGCKCRLRLPCFITSTGPWPGFSERWRQSRV
jgi:hypothetical protein